MTSSWNDVTICRNYVTDTWDGQIKMTVVSTECNVKLRYPSNWWHEG